MFYWALRTLESLQLIQSWFEKKTEYICVGKKKEPTDPPQPKDQNFNPDEVKL